MKHLKLFENFEEDEYLDSIEDYLLEWLDTGEAQLAWSNEWMRVYTFENGELADSAKRRLDRMDQPGWRSKYGEDAIVIFKPELAEFLDDKLLNSEIYPSKENKNILVWRKGGEVRANQDSKNGWLYIKSEGIWSVFRERYSMDYLAVKAFIRGWLWERYKLRGLTPSPCRCLGCCCCGRGTN